MSYECADCGYQSAKWMGRCPACSRWETFIDIEKEKKAAGGSGGRGTFKSERMKLSSVKSKSTERIKSRINGIDRLLGGGAVKGEVVLLGGPPGIGKSTLFLQIADNLGRDNGSVLYVSGEENPSQIKVHADRLGISGEGITILCSGNLNEVEEVVEELNPDFVFIDSIQAVADSNDGGSPGSVKQVKKSGQRVAAAAKNTGSVFFISGQITKQGDIAGPKVLEHIVDAVFYMDMVENNVRIISAAKNRFGSCGDFVLFDLSQKGLREMENIERVDKKGEKPAQGSAFCAINSGQRKLVVEIQSLVSPSYFEYPLRRTSGFSRQRLLIISAITVKHMGLNLSGKDIYLNVSGTGMVNERSGDLAVAASLYSSCREVCIPSEFMFMGEVDLNGKVRPLKDAKLRAAFARRNGFSEVVLSGYGEKIKVSGVKFHYINHIRELKNLIKESFKMKGVV